VTQQSWAPPRPDDTRPSDRAGPPRVGLLSVHTSPLERPGAGDSGGMNVYLSSLASHLVRRGVTVDVFTRATGADLPPSVAVEDGITVHHLDAGPAHASKSELASHLCAFYLAMANHPATAALDVVHAHYWMSGWVGRHLQRRQGLPLVSSFHTLARVKNDALAPGDVPEPAIRLTAEERVAAASDALIASTAAEAAILEQLGAARGRIHVVPAGVDLDVFTPTIDRQRARQALGGGRIVLFVGRLQPLKAPDLAVRALAALDTLMPDDGLPTRLVVVGGPSGPASETAHPAGLRRLADALGVADRVAFLAPREQPALAPLYRAADAVIVPSHSESFGLVALEAQACGTPVVASDVAGLRSIVGGGGTLVGSRDPQAFAAALLPYLTDAHRRAEASAAAVETAAGYGWDRTAGATLAAYEHVLGSTAAEVQRRGA